MSRLSGCRMGCLIALVVSVLSWAFLLALAYTMGRLAGMW